MSVKTTLLVAIGLLGVAPPLASAADEKPMPAAVAGVEWRASARKLALEHFKNPAWGYSHSQRDYALAKELADEDKVTLDDDVLYASSLLHDIAAFEPWADAKRDHSDVGADLVDSILGKTKVPGRVISPAGKARQTARKAELEEFLKSLRRQTQDLQNL